MLQKASTVPSSVFLDSNTALSHKEQLAMFSGLKIRGQATQPSCHDTRVSSEDLIRSSLAASAVAMDAPIPDIGMDGPNAAAAEQLGSMAGHYRSLSDDVAADMV